MHDEQSRLEDAAPALRQQPMAICTLLYLHNRSSGWDELSHAYQCHKCSTSRILAQNVRPHMYTCIHHGWVSWFCNHSWALCYRIPPLRLFCLQRAAQQRHGHLPNLRNLTDINMSACCNRRDAFGRRERTNCHRLKTA